MDSNKRFTYILLLVLNMPLHYCMLDVSSWHASIFCTKLNRSSTLVTPVPTLMFLSYVFLLLPARFFPSSCPSWFTYRFPKTDFIVYDSMGYISLASLYRQRSRYHDYTQHGMADPWRRNSRSQRTVEWLPQFIQMDLQIAEYILVRYLEVGSSIPVVREGWNDFFKSSSAKIIHLCVTSAASTLTLFNISITRSLIRVDPRGERICQSVPERFCFLHGASQEYV